MLPFCAGYCSSLTQHFPSFPLPSFIFSLTVFIFSFPSPFLSSRLFLTFVLGFRSSSFSLLSISLSSFPTQSSWSPSLFPHPNPSPWHRLLLSQSSVLFMPHHSCFCWLWLFPTFLFLSTVCVCLGLAKFGLWSQTVSALAPILHAHCPSNPWFPLRAALKYS